MAPTSPIGPLRNFSPSLKHIKAINQSVSLETCAGSRCALSYVIEQMKMTKYDEVPHLFHLLLPVNLPTFSSFGSQESSFFFQQVFSSWEMHPFFSFFMLHFLHIIAKTSWTKY